MQTEKDVYIQLIVFLCASARELYYITVHLRLQFPGWEHIRKAIKTHIIISHLNELLGKSTFTTADKHTIITMQYTYILYDIISCFYHYVQSNTHTVEPHIPFHSDIFFLVKKWNYSCEQQGAIKTNRFHWICLFSPFTNAFKHVLP